MGSNPTSTFTRSVALDKLINFTNPSNHLNIAMKIKQSRTEYLVYKRSQDTFTLISDVSKR